MATLAHLAAELVVLSSLLHDDGSDRPCTVADIEATLRDYDTPPDYPEPKLICAVSHYLAIRTAEGHVQEVDKDTYTITKRGILYMETLQTLLKQKLEPQIDARRNEREQDAPR